MVSGSSIKFSVWMVPQRQKLKDHEFSMYFSEMVPQACLRCLRLFSCLGDSFRKQGKLLGGYFLCSGSDSELSCNFKSRCIRGC